jgi:hypothetical protein
MDSPHVFIVPVREKNAGGKKSEVVNFSGTASDHQRGRQKLADPFSSVTVWPRSIKTLHFSKRKNSENKFKRRPRSIRRKSSDSAARRTSSGPADKLVSSKFQKGRSFSTLSGSHSRVLCPPFCGRQLSHQKTRCSASVANSLSAEEISAR